MDIKEAKKIIFKWLKEKEFKRVIIPGAGPFDYVHSLGEFSVLISFYKERFSESFIFDVGCYFDDCEYGYATIDVRNLSSNQNSINNPQGIYYGELNGEQLLNCLDEMFDKYLNPYYVKGKEYLKEIVLNEFQFDGKYSIAKGARQKINEMFGLNTKS